MTLDEEIRLAKQEKEIKKVESYLLEGYNENLNESEMLNFRYSENGSELLEFNYSDAISEIARNGVSTLEEANGIAYIIDSKIPANEILESKTSLYNALTDVRKLYESTNDCKTLAKIYCGLNEATSTSKKRAALDHMYGDPRNPEDMKHMENYIRGKETARHFATHPAAKKKFKDDKAWDPSVKPSTPKSATKNGAHDKFIEKKIVSIKKTAEAMKRADENKK